MSYDDAMDGRGNRKMKNDDIWEGSGGGAIETGEARASLGFGLSTLFFLIVVFISCVIDRSFSAQCFRGVITRIRRVFTTTRENIICFHIR